MSMSEIGGNVYGFNPLGTEVSYRCRRFPKS